MTETIPPHIAIPLIIILWSWLGVLAIADRRARRRAVSEHYQRQEESWPKL